MSSTTEAQEFEEFMKRRGRAAAAYVSGDAGPLEAIAARRLPATFFGPGGGYVHGTDRVANRYASDAESFQPGGESSFEILEMACCDDIAYWIGFQKATARIQGKDERIPFDLRITEIFRREGRDWKLVHRHADPLAQEKTSKG
jgi:ketosteroid isomerase-like protein